MSEIEISLYIHDLKKLCKTKKKGIYNLKADYGEGTNPEYTYQRLSDNWVYKIKNGQNCGRVPFHLQKSIVNHPNFIGAKKSPVIFSSQRLKYKNLDDDTYNFLLFHNSLPRNEFSHISNKNFKFIREYLNSL